MISFMIEQVSWLSIIAAAAAGVFLTIVWHLLFGRLFERFEHGWCRPCEKGEKEEHRCCATQHVAAHGHKKNECANMYCMLWHKLGLFIIYFAQAYGLAYFLERLKLLNDLSDAIYLSLFIGVVFIISHLYAMVIWHKKSFLHFLFKAALKLFILAIMAWILVYFAQMAAANA